MSLAHAYFSVKHIQSAAYFARQCAKIEQTRVSDDWNTVHISHQACVTGTVGASINFLDATINELFADAARDDDETRGRLGPQVVRLIGDLWKRGIPSKANLTSLEKYQLVLDFDTQAGPRANEPLFREVNLLAKLYNALLRNEPNWLFGTDERKRTSELDRLRLTLHKKFAANPLRRSNVESPEYFLGHGCAAWAVDASIAWTDLFFNHIGLRPIYDHVRPSLLTN